MGRGYVALRQEDDAKGVPKAIGSLIMAFKHSAAIQVRLLSNSTLLRREHYVANVAISTTAKNTLLSLLSR